jgi:hypothetical protein
VWGTQCLAYKDGTGSLILIFNVLGNSNEQFQLLLLTYSDNSCATVDKKGGMKGQIKYGKKFGTSEGLTAQEIDLTDESGTLLALAGLEGRSALYLALAGEDNVRPTGLKSALKLFPGKKEKALEMGSDELGNNPLAIDEINAMVLPLLQQ